MNKTDLMNIITEVLIDHDLEGLISSGAPMDEYEPEAKAIAEFIINNRKANQYQLVDNIQRTFLYYFDDFIDINDCMQVAEDILTRLV